MGERGREARSTQWLWAALAVVGTVIPYAAFAPWLLDHGPDVGLLLDEMFANRIAALFALDVLVSGAVIVAVVVIERERLGRRWWLPLAGLATVGVSLALPLLLWLRARRRSAAS